jgi:hypothetical protein
MDSADHHKQAKLAAAGSPALEDQLRETRPWMAPGVGFTENVLNALPTRQTAPASAAAPSIAGFPRIALAVLAVCAMAVVLRESNSPRIPIEAKSASVPNESSNLFPPEMPFPEITSASIESITATIDQPLDREMKNVVSDTRQAIRFVAANFLPEN